MSSFLRAFFSQGLLPPQSASSTASSTASSSVSTISQESTPAPTNSPTASYSVAPSEISEKSEPECSPPASESESELSVASTFPSSFNESKVYEELMKNIPKFDGSSNITKLLEFADAVEDFAESADIRPATLLSLATSKLSGDARLWWREHKERVPHTDPNRIKNWTQLKLEIFRAFAPPEHETSIRDKLRAIRQTGSIADYNASFRRLTMQLPYLGFPEAKYAYLRGVNPRIRDLVSTRDDVNDMRTLQHLCLRFDHREPEKSEKRADAFISEAPKYHKFKKDRGTTRIGDKKGDTSAATTLVCSFCDKKGHSIEKCYKMLEAKRALSKPDDTRTSAHTSEAISEAHPKALAFATVIDSGASNHMFKNLADFQETSPKRVTITCANAEKTTSKNIGTVPISLGSTGHTVLQDVLHVPALKHNLISVRGLVKAGNEVLFRRDGAVILTDEDENSRIIGEPVNDIYVLSPQTPPSPSPSANHASAASSASGTIDLWHHRLGHPGNRTLENIHKFVTGIDKPLKLDATRPICEGCALAKSHRAPFPSSSKTRATEILGRLHTDLCGPLAPSPGGARYILTFIDDATRFTRVFFLTQKSDAFEKFQEFHVNAEKQTGKPLKVLRSDGGGEYINAVFRDYLKSKGINHEVTVPDSPQQNGVAERYNRTLLETIRAFTHAAGIPEKLWAEIANTACYVRNRLPSRANPENKTPFELWYGRQPSVNHLRVIWSDAYAHTLKNKRKSKLAPRATKLKLLGYESGRKAYRLWDPAREIVVISRDVVFDESVVLNHRPINPENEEYAIESIIGERDIDGHKEYLVKWLGFSSDDDTWEPLENVAETEALDKWENRAISMTTISEHSIPEGHSITEDDTNTLIQAFLAGQSISDPSSFKEATQAPDAPHWLAAISDELHSLAKNHTWDIIPLDQTQGRVPIGCRWVFKRKLRPDGSIDKYKARLVAKGYNQRFGIDYEETYAPVAKFTSIRSVLAIGALLDLEIHQMDVKTAFLHGDLEEEIFMAIPEGVSAPEKSVCRLRRSLYGLKQSPRCWNRKIDEFLVSLDFHRLESDHSIYVRGTPNNPDFSILALYVDDLLLLTKNPATMSSLKGKLASRFEMSDCGEVSHFLGISVLRDRPRRTISIHQEHFAAQILGRFDMSECHAVATPLDPSIKLCRAPSEGEISEKADKPADVTLFRSIVGSLMYLMVSTRPDIASAIGIISQFAADPRQSHLSAARRMLRYIKGTKNFKLMLGAITTGDNPEKPILSGYSDANWGNDLDSRRSTSGYIFLVSGGVVSWSSKRQATVALSSTEAEYMALTQATKEAIWLRTFLNELGFHSNDATTIFEDNQSAIALAKNPVHHARTKHIDIRHHYIREKLESGDIRLEYIHTSDMVADALTKPLPRPAFEKHVRDMNMRP
jgi:hypothetical protein